MENEWTENRLPDVLHPGLSIVFVGINPGKRSAEIRHHFAGHNNFFWRLLHESGLTSRQLKPEEDKDLLLFGYGLTNIVDLPSRSSSDLRLSQFSDGARELVDKMQAYVPKIICLLGKQVYRSYAQIPSSRKVDWGRQSNSILKDTIDYVAPNPSARSTIPYQNRLEIFRNLKMLRDVTDDL